MKSPTRNLSVLTFLFAVGHGSADVIYSGLQNTPIALTYDGILIDVDTNGTWDLNPYLGGVYLANNTAFQPARVGTGGMDTVNNYAAGILINNGMLYATGMGGSIDHLGSTFTPDTEGYLGFKLNGTNYGWMRVVFTNNTSGAMIRDWAYDNTNGAAIATGNVLQNGSTVTLDSALGSFTLGSQIGGSNSLVKNGSNSVTLTATNNYSGTTTVNAGTLLVNGSLAGTGAVGVGGGLTVATLGGIGSLNGAVTVNDLGVLAPGASIESLASGALTFNTGSTFAYEMNHSALPGVAGDLQIVNGNLSLTGTVNLALTDLSSLAGTFAPNTTTLSLIQYAGTWNGGFFTYGNNELVNNEAFTDSYGNNWKITYNAEIGGANFATPIPDSHFITLSNLTAIPEPGSLLALGCLIGSGTFLRIRRRR